MALTRVSPGVYRNAKGGLVQQGRPPQRQQQQAQNPAPGLSLPAQQTAQNPNFGNFLQQKGFRDLGNGNYRGPGGKVRSVDQLAARRQGALFARDAATATAGRDPNDPTWGGENYWGGVPGWQMDDPAGALNAQQGMNQWNIDQQMRFNRPNEQNPYGDLQYIENPDGSITQRQTLNPWEEQKLGQDRSRDVALGELAGVIGGNVGKSFQDPYDISGIGNDPRNVDFSGERKRLEDQLSSRFEELNGKRLSDEREQLKSRLLNSGVTMGSDLYNNQMQELERRQNDERRAAQVDAMRMGGSEMQRSYDMSQDARSRAIGEYDTQRNAAYQDLAKVLGIRGGVNNPQFQARESINIPGLDIAGTALGYADLAQRQKEANRSYKLQMAQLRRSGGGGGGGGGGGFDLNTDPSFLRWKGQQDYLRQYGPKEKKPSAIEQWGPTLAYLGGALGGAYIAS